MRIEWAGEIEVNGEPTYVIVQGVWYAERKAFVNGPAEWCYEGSPEEVEIEEVRVPAVDVFTPSRDVLGELNEETVKELEHLLARIGREEVAEARLPY